MREGAQGDYVKEHNHKQNTNKQTNKKKTKRKKQMRLEKNTTPEKRKAQPLGGCNKPKDLIVVCVFVVQKKKKNQKTNRCLLSFPLFVPAHYGGNQTAAKVQGGGVVGSD